MFRSKSRTKETNMMDVLSIKATRDTPHVHFDKESGKLELTGRSMPDDARSFFTPLKEWIIKYAQEPQTKTKVVIDLEYFNSASSTMIYELLKELARIQSGGHELEAEWHYLDGDYDMEEAGKIFSEITHIPFSFQSYE